MHRRSRTHRPLAAVALLLAAMHAVHGCGLAGAGPTTLEQFSDAFRDALANDSPASLYDLLDAQSRGDLSRQLEQLRGLDIDARQSVLQQLGLDAGTSLIEMPAERYFALLWRKALGGAAITSVEAEAAGPTTGVLTITTDTSRTEQFDLLIEAGQWAWRMPTPRTSQSSPPPGRGRPNAPDPPPGPEADPAPDAG